MYIIKPVKTDKELEKKIEKIICMRCFDNSLEPLLDLFHSYALGIEKLPKLKKISFKDMDFRKHQKIGFNEAITQVQEIIEDGKTIYEQRKKVKI